MRHSIEDLKFSIELDNQRKMQIFATFMTYDMALILADIHHFMQLAENLSKWTTKFPIHSVIICVRR